jgi:hypothetical protein
MNCELQLSWTLTQMKIPLEAAERRLLALTICP